MTTVDRVKQLVPLDRREWNVVAPLALVGFFISYDVGLLTLAGPVIADGLGVDIDEFGAGVAIIRLGSLGSLVTLSLSDRIGRRSLLLASVVGFTVATGITALSTGLVIFVATQFISRLFLATEESLAGVVLTEELEPEHRGLGQTVLGTIAMTGFGVVAVAVLVVPHVWPGWRLLYLIALAPLASVIWLRRNLDETAAFELAKEEGRTAGPRLRELGSNTWGRLTAASVLFAAEGFVTLPAVFYAAARAEDEFGWTVQMTFVVLGSGLWTLLGWILGGRVSDHVGRRPMVAVGLLMMSIGIPAIFLGGTMWFRAGFWLSAAGGAVFAASRGAYLGELFPTEIRSTATAIVSALSVIAGSAGLLVAAALPGGDHDLPWMVLALLPALAALAWLPETAGSDVTRSESAPTDDDDDDVIIDLTTPPEPAPPQPAPTAASMPDSDVTVAGPQ